MKKRHISLSAAVVSPARLPLFTCLKPVLYGAKLIRMPRLEIINNSFGSPKIDEGYRDILQVKLVGFFLRNLSSQMPKSYSSNTSRAGYGKKGSSACNNYSCFQTIRYKKYTIIGISIFAAQKKNKNKKQNNTPPRAKIGRAHV